MGCIGAEVLVLNSSKNLVLPQGKRSTSSVNIYYGDLLVQGIGATLPLMGRVTNLLSLCDPSGPPPDYPKHVYFLITFGMKKNKKGKFF